MKIGEFFWWLGPVKSIIIYPFWWAVLLIIVFATPYLRTWWWLIAPIILMFPVKKFYMWWVRWDCWYPKQKWVMLEMIPPKEILAPFRAMEDVFSVVWTIGDTANWRERWCDGELPLAPNWASWEIASIEGKIHFYIRCLDVHRHVIESTIYSHYPEIEISETSDYTKNVPQNIPNEEWNLYGSDFVLSKEDAYPIKTYSSFFEEKTETKEEKRIDPIVSLLEDMARLGPGEQFWLQIITAPITNDDIPWVDEAKEIINKVARRPGKKKSRGFFGELVDVPVFLINGIKDVTDLFVTGKTVEETEKSAKERYLSQTLAETGEKEMLLTPGEREILFAIENKIKKLAYKTNIRGIYLAKRESFKLPHRRVGESYFPHFITLNLNSIRFTTKTRTKIHYIWRQKRTHVRQKKMFRNYIERFPALFPKLTGAENPILNAEELATIFHFPTKITSTTASTVVRVEAKKGGPPPNLPVE